jgi:diguanylate cyclase (GGDEF)-like protein
VNDTRGHADGDALLVEVAERLTDLLHGRPGALVARLGGDEFAMLLPHTRAADAEQLADSVVSALARPYAAAPEIPVTVSVGLTVGRADDHDPGLLLRGADLAMYDAKSNGRGRWSRYAEHMHADLLARVELESQLREGLHRGELVLHYQPVVHLRTGARCGVEALVRWRHPERGLLSRGAFVPLAEKSDLIVALGWFVLQQACWQMAAWRAELGPHESGGSAPAEVAVSVSPRELSQPGYTAQVLATLHRVGLPPGCVVLEVTESTMMSDTSQVIQVLTDLRAAGIRIAIDDFGTGHSSLARLHQLPVDQVKIDRSFIVAAAADEDKADDLDRHSTSDTTMLELLVAVVDRLGLDVVAEGIETSRQLEAVRDTGCTYGQGYLLGRPQPAADVCPAVVPPLALGR